MENSSPSTIITLYRECVGTQEERPGEAPIDVVCTLCPCFTKKYNTILDKLPKQIPHYLKALDKFTESKEWKLQEEKWLIRWQKDSFVKELSGEFTKLFKELASSKFFAPIVTRRGGCCGYCCGVDGIKYEERIQGEMLESCENVELEKFEELLKYTRFGEMIEKVCMPANYPQRRIEAGDLEKGEEKNDFFHLREAMDSYWYNNLLKIKEKRVTFDTTEKQTEKETKEEKKEEKRTEKETNIPVTIDHTSHPSIPFLVKFVSNMNWLGRTLPMREIFKKYYCYHFDDESWLSPEDKRELLKKLWTEYTTKVCYDAAENFKYELQTKIRSRRVCVVGCGLSVVLPLFCIATIFALIVLISNYVKSL